MSENRRVEIRAEELQAIAQLLSEFPNLDLAALRGLAQQANGRRRKPEPIRPRSWAEITGAVEAGWMTKNEARKLVGLQQRSGPARRSRPSPEAAR